MHFPVAGMGTAVRHLFPNVSRPSQKPRYDDQRFGDITESIHTVTNCESLVVTSDVRSERHPLFRGKKTLLHSDDAGFAGAGHVSA